MSTAKYLVNGVVSTFWSRVLKSKTTYVVLAFVLANVEKLFDGTDWTNLVAWRDTAIVTLGGATLIMIRSGQVKAEMAANAANQRVDNVDAVVSPDKPKSPMVMAGVMAAVAGMIGLIGCTAGSKLGEVLTNPDGKPVVTGTICVNTPNGRFCYVPDTETIVAPETVPDGVAAAPAPVVVPAPVAPYGAPIMAAPTPLPQLAK